MLQLMEGLDRKHGHRNPFGMTLGRAGRDFLRLAIAGYQFPEAKDPNQRYSWYLVDGSATASGRSWDFKWQALTCDDAPLISQWLRQIASWASQPDSRTPPDTPWLIEPNLQFRSVDIHQDMVELAVELDLEFLPPEHRRERHRAGNPERLTLQATPAELVTAAADFDATIALFPIRSADST
jgi:hypothetical protein